MFDEVKEFFRKRIEQLFFGDNEIQGVSENYLDEPIIIVSVKDKDGNLKKWKITEVKENK